MLKPVLTWSPVCNSDIDTDIPFSIMAVATDGKQAPPPESESEFYLLFFYLKKVFYCLIIIHNFKNKSIKTSFNVSIILIENSYNFETCKHYRSLLFGI